MFRKYWPALTIFLLLVIAAFLRLWKLPETLLFLGDQGRDALTVAKIFTEGDLVFIGPVTSVGNMYLGPLYYYFMLPFLRLSYPSPVGPAYAMAILGILTVFLVYHWGKRLIGRRAAMIAAGLYAVSATTVTYARFSWNPNPAPLVGLTMIYATYLAGKKSAWWWVVVAICFSILMQLHYLALLSIGGAGLVWLLQLRDGLRKKPAQTNDKLDLRHQLLATGVSVLIVLASLTPLMLFDSKHDWLNVRAFQKLVTQEDTFSGPGSESLITKIPATIKETHGRGMHILFEITVGKHRLVNTLLLGGVAVGLTFLLTRRRQPHQFGTVVIVCYLLTGILGTAVYEHTIFDHYIAYLFPVTFFVFGLLLAALSRHLIGKILAGAFVIFFLSWNVPRLPLKAGGWNIYDMERVSQTVYQHLSPGETYSLVLLSPSKDLYAQNYRYFLSTTDRPPLPPERAGEAQTLVVIDEEQTSNVGSLPIYEITIFPVKNPSEVYTIDQGPRIYFFRKI